MTVHDLLRVADLDADELLGLLEIAVRMKANQREFADAARGRVAAIVFEKPSLRTRFSIEAALIRIGAHPIGAYDREVGIGSREPIPDVAKVLSRFADAIAIRTFGHDRARALADASDSPVVNALSDEHHPLQALADLMTVAEASCGGDPRALKGLRVAYVGDGNNVAHSLVEAGALAGMTVACACPDGFRPYPGIVRWARENGGIVDITDDPAEAVRDAVAVYTDVWTSMGQEEESAIRRSSFEGFQVTNRLMSLAAPGAIFLHCLPAHRGEEVAAEVIDGPASRVFDQAENRMHTAAAVFLRLFDAA